jgi:hypothetical protein
MRRTLVTIATATALAAGAGGAGPALAAGGADGAAKKPAKPKPAKPKPAVPKGFKSVETGTRLSTDGPRFEDTYKVQQSPFGEGTVIRDATFEGSSFPASGTDNAKTYDRGGRTFAHETFTLGTPNVDGVGPITGNGTCRSGTGTHHGETCTYTIAGTYDLITGVTTMTLTGTYTLHTTKRVK